MKTSVYENFNFVKIQELRPFNARHFETILPNLPLDDCNIQGKYTVV